MSHENLTESRRLEIANQFREVPQMEAMLKELEKDPKFVQTLNATQKMSLELYRRDREIARQVTRARRSRTP